jgi:tRNA(Ile)-lysidine synthase
MPASRSAFALRHSLVRKVAAYMAEQRMLEAGRDWAVAVSGGADSMALLHVLVALRGEFGLSLRVAHVNHGLRGRESDADQALVEAESARLQLPLHVLALSAGQAPASGVEEWAREERLAFYRSLLVKGECQQVATGHTQRDQAETVLFRFLRGSGPSGLAGIAPVSPLGLVRPLLCATREEVLAYLEEFGIPWREDASNTDPRFARNRLRGEWLPALRKAWNPQLDLVLAGTAEIFREENEYLDRIADGEIARQFQVSVYGWEANADQLVALPVAVLRRVLRGVAQRVAGVCLPFAHLEEVRGLLASPTVPAREAAGGKSLQGRSGQFSAQGLLAERSGAHFRMVSEEAVSCRSEARERRDSAFEVRVPGRYPLPGGRAELVLARMAATPETLNGFNRLDSGYTEGWSFLSLPQPGCVLTARFWRPGDSFQLSGASGPRKLKEWFQRRGVPRWRREDAVVLERQGQLLWCRYLGASALEGIRPELVTRAAKPGSEESVECVAIRCEPSAGR